MWAPCSYTLYHKDMKYTTHRYIHKLLAGTLLEEERLELINWFDNLSAEESQAFFEELGQYMDRLDDEQVARLEDVLQHLREQSISTVAASKSRSLPFWKAAAIITLLLVGSVVLLNYLKKREALSSESAKTLVWKTITNPARTRAKLRLPDSSWVWLNAGSKLVYPEQFDDSVRLVKLVGEAFFEIQEDNQRPFYVQSSRLVTQVLGTAFNMKVFEHEPLVVTVQSGKVKVTGEKEERVLAPNQQVEYLEGMGLSAVKAVDASVSASWRNGVLNLNNKTLWQATREMERWYGVTIRIDKEKLKNCVIAGEHTNTGLYNVLNSLAFVLKLRYTTNGNEIVITDGKCP